MTTYRSFSSPEEAKEWMASILSHGGILYEPVDEEQRKDCEKIVSDFALYGVVLTVQEAAVFWDEYSLSLGAGWIYIGPQSDCVRALDHLVYESRKALA